MAFLLAVLSVLFCRDLDRRATVADGIIPGTQFGGTKLTVIDRVKWLKIVYAFQLLYIASVSIVKFSM